MPSTEFISGVVGLTLTLLVFSYLLGDNPLFRMAVYLFVGISAGYAAAVTWNLVLWPKLFIPLVNADLSQFGVVIIPLLLGMLLLFKFSPRLSFVGNLPMAVLVGVSAAAAVGGALLGTLLPQTQAAIDALDLGAAASRGFNPFTTLFNGAFLLAGTVSTLAYFHFGAGRAPDGSPKRNRILEMIAWVGRIFLAIAFGALFAGVYMAALTAMIERLNTILQFLGS